ncbi:MAG: DUF21 domain-containing protein, partial [Planctomycetes bacterium]|nr:DUF21 domain-containing protein [Planctomycetota bacterium]
MTLQVLLLLALLACSALFSGAETAIFSLSRYELSRMSRGRNRAGRLVVDLMRYPRHLLLTLMIGNVTTNMFIFAVSLSVCRDLVSQAPMLGAALGLVSPVVVTVFADLLPKSAAIVSRRQLAPLVAPAVRLVQIPLAPVTYVLHHALVTPLTRLLAGAQPPDEYVTSEELNELIEMSEQHRIIDADENAMLGEVIRLRELRVYDVMVPRVDMIAFDVHDDPAELLRILRERKFTKIPVYDARIDNILGVVYAKDLFLNPYREPGT